MAGDGDGVEQGDEPGAGLDVDVETAGGAELRKYVAPMSLEATSDRLVGIYQSLVAGRRPAARSASAHVIVGY